MAATWVCRSNGAAVITRGSYGVRTSVAERMEGRRSHLLKWNVFETKAAVDHCRCTSDG